MPKLEMLVEAFRPCPPYHSTEFTPLLALIFNSLRHEIDSQKSWMPAREHVGGETDASLPTSHSWRHACGCRAAGEACVTCPCILAWTIRLDV